MIFRLILGTICLSVAINSPQLLLLAIGGTIGYTLSTLITYGFNRYLIWKIDRLLNTCEEIEAEEGHDMSEEIERLLEIRETLEENMK